MCLCVCCGTRRGNPFWLDFCGKLFERMGEPRRKKCQLLQGRVNSPEKGSKYIKVLFKIESLPFEFSSKINVPLTGANHNSRL